MTLNAPRQWTDSERAWLDLRTYLRENRHELTAHAAAEFPDAAKVAGTHLLASPGWVPERPFPLDAITMDLQPGTTFRGMVSEVTQQWLPARTGGRRYASYSEAIGELARPTVFVNRATYRLASAELTNSRIHLTFGTGTYFDSIDMGEAAAHEFALKYLGEPIEGGIRDAIGDPCDPQRRPMNLAISTVTIRRDRRSGEDTFFLHWRDPAKVGHAGGMYQVVPVGIFQPSGEPEWNLNNDFSLWRNTIREFAEELVGADEDHNSGASPIDYVAWPFAVNLDQARASGKLRAYCLGLGVDPLTFATDLLTAVIVDADVFDELFGNVVTDNAEGRVLAAQRFDADSVERLLSEHPMQPAGAALLRLAVASDLP